MTKSQNNRVLTGTLAGIAEYFGVDPTLVSRVTKKCWFWAIENVGIRSSVLLGLSTKLWKLNS